MVHANPSLDQDRLRKTLIAVFERALPACSETEYRLVGTGAALLHGVQLPAADIDILVRSRDGVTAFGTALASFECIVSPNWMPEARQYYANYAILGVEVGISTVEMETELDTIETFGRGPWEHYAVLTCGAYAVPTVALELRLITELHRNRPDRFDPIIAFMQGRRCDLDLVSRGLDNIGLAPERCEEILIRLRGTPGET